MGSPMNGTAGLRAPHPRPAAGDSPVKRGRDYAQKKRFEHFGY
jgi:hypothetical protein